MRVRREWVAGGLALLAAAVTAVAAALPGGDRPAGPPGDGDPPPCFGPNDLPAAGRPG